WGSPVNWQAECLARVLGRHVVPRTLSHHDDLDLLKAEPEMPKSSNRGGSRAQCRDVQTREKEDGIGRFECRDRRRVHIMLEVEDDMIEVDSDHVQSGLYLLRGQVSALHSGRAGEDRETARMLGNQAAKKRLIEALEVFQCVEDRVRGPEVEEGRNI